MAYEYHNALKDILVYGDVSDCDMEKGMVRCDVNVSVRVKGQKELGAKIEIKNMNSFSGVRKALEYEISRQIEVLKSLHQEPIKLGNRPRFQFDGLPSAIAFVDEQLVIDEIKLYLESVRTVRDRWSR